MSTHTHTLSLCCVSLPPSSLSLVVCVSSVDFSSSYYNLGSRDLENVGWVKGEEEEEEEEEEEKEEESLFRRRRRRRKGLGGVFSSSSS